MIVVDTTILVYAVGSTHPLKDPSVRFFAAVAAGNVDATTTPEVIQEFAHVRARRFSRSDAVAVARDFTHLLSPLLTSDELALDRGLDVFERYAELGSFDALLAATAIAADATALLSADSAFGSLSELPHLMPGGAAFERLLS